PACDPVLPPSSHGRSTHHAAIWAVAPQYLSFAIQFAASVIISRYYLTPGEVGLFSIALALSLLIAVLNDFGLTRFITGLPTVDPETVQRCMTVSFMLAVGVASVTAVAAWPVARLYGMPGLIPLLQWIAAGY